jgi:hypothetical protein
MLSSTHDLQVGNAVCETRPAQSLSALQRDSANVSWPATPASAGSAVPTSRAPTERHHVRKFGRGPDAADGGGAVAAARDGRGPPGGPSAPTWTRPAPPAARRHDLTGRHQAPPPPPVRSTGRTPHTQGHSPPPWGQGHGPPPTPSDVPVAMAAAPPPRPSSPATPVAGIPYPLPPVAPALDSQAYLYHALAVDQYQQQLCALEEARVHRDYWRGVSERLRQPVDMGGARGYSTLGQLYLANAINPATMGAIEVGSAYGCASPQGWPSAGQGNAGGTTTARMGPALAASPALPSVGAGWSPHVVWAPSSPGASHWPPPSQGTSNPLPIKYFLLSTFSPTCHYHVFSTAARHTCFRILLTPIEC